MSANGGQFPSERHGWERIMGSGLADLPGSGGRKNMLSSIRAIGGKNRGKGGKALRVGGGKGVSLKKTQKRNGCGGEFETREGKVGAEGRKQSEGEGKFDEEYP